ncbi:major facilitator superfamily domain-containing protein [Lentinula edodes]|uniref:Major facilitator superfamily domain-containing protein n=1 Tax=Lentinula lateritia TaxID=40482 RepID=A0A9W8ZY40_9AGAR|nr:major facilitator superfamily domain-containing protein [Lentinula edodes]
MALVESPSHTYEKNVISPPREKLEHEFPEGGLQAWLTVIGGWMVVFCTFGAIQSFGVYQDYYSRVSLSEKSPSDISWIGSVQIFFLFAGGIISGKLFDDGYFKQLLFVGSLIYLISSFLLSLAEPHHYYQNFLAQGVGIGLGMGIVFLPTLSVTAHYFKKKRGLVMGIILSGSSVGAVVYPIMINHLFNGPTGFAWGVRAVSFLDLGFLITANLIMKTRLAPRRTDPHAGPINLRGILTDIPFWVALFGTVVCHPLFFYIQTFAVKHDLATFLQTYALSILNAAGFFGRTLPMFISDMYGPFNVIIPVTFISGCMVFAFLGATSVGGMLAFAIIYGFFSGGFVSVSAPVAASFSYNVGEVGTRIGLMTFVCSFGLLTGNPISGAILDPPRYNWVKPVVFSAVTVLAGTLFLLLARQMQVKRKGTEWI